ncbi:hypothetical protein Poli38472_000415 [Pythium oligandrum]|uniref:Uncharacterized protein n=1 Tax=Pythium oligandrum TaxID=41045 RepID=A0A8K1FJ43_PYTOL|nr:hypothetical protein Poli38472_000415 [Pythium oligandrum]|eukprot:TMW60373.1 hypothetical protein Poli38472_000415 [Pythium oligandrum]
MASRSRSQEADVLSLDTPESENDRPKTPRRPGTSSGRSKQLKVTEFRKFLENDELPLRIESAKSGGRRVVWTTSLDQLDFAQFLPLCVGGLQETLEPYPSFAFDAGMQILEHGLNDKRVLKCLPLIMNQIKSALGTREKEIVHRVLLLLQQLSVCEGVGEALTDYYRAVLPLCNILQDKHLGTGDELTREMVAETLETLEAYGKDDAHVVIQQYVPTFQQQFPSDRLVST